MVVPKGSDTPVVVKTRSRVYKDLGIPWVKIGHRKGDDGIGIKLRVHFVRAPVPSVGIRPQSDVETGCIDGIGKALGGGVIELQTFEVGIVGIGQGIVRLQGKFKLVPRQERRIVPDNPKHVDILIDGQGTQVGSAQSQAGMKGVIQLEHACPTIILHW